MPADRGPPPSGRVHGGPDRAELAGLGLEASDLLDLSVNVNPYGPSPVVLEAVRQAPLHRYPDPAATEIRTALAARWRRDVGEVLFAHGVTEILWDLARYLARSRTRTLVVEPAFSELRAGIVASGGEVVEWRADPGRGLAVELDEVCEAVARSGAGAVHLATPTSPAGIPVPVAEIARFARTCDGVLLLLDESFLSLSDRHEEAEAPLPDNVVRLRSMTKEHAIPGLRVGYALAPAAVVASLEAARPTWSTSAPAQAAALAALGEEGFLAASRERLREDREAMRADLARLGLSTLPSVAPYLAFPVKDAAALRRRLLGRRVLVRDCRSFGLPDFVRVATRPPTDRAAFVAALEDELR